MPSNVWPKAIPLLILAGLCAYSNCVSKTLVFDDDAWIVDQPLLDDPPEYFKSMEGRPLLAQGQQPLGDAPVAPTEVSAPLLPGVPNPATPAQAQQQTMHTLTTPVLAGAGWNSNQLRWAAPPKTT